MKSREVAEPHGAGVLDGGFVGQQVLGVDHQPRRVVHGVQQGGLHRVQLHGLDVVVDGGDLVVVRVVQGFGDTLVHQGVRRESGDLVGRKPDA